MTKIPAGSHPDRPLDVTHLAKGVAESDLQRDIGEGSPSPMYTTPHVIKVSGVAGCHFWGISTAPLFIADGEGIFPVLQELGFPKVFYTAAARDKIIALFT